MDHDERAAKVELSQLYAAGADDQDFDAMAALFGPDAQLVTPRGVRSGVDEIRQALEGLRVYDGTFHLLGQIRTWVDEDGTHRGQTYCTAHHFTAEDSASGDSGVIVDRVIHIRYHDQHLASDQSPNGWLFAARRLEFMASGDQRLHPPQP